MRYRTTILQTGKTTTGIPVPDEVVEALGVEPAARRTFDVLSYSNRSWHVLQVTGGQDRRDPPAPHRQVGRGPEGRSPAMSKLAVVEYVSPDG
jgi:hypothetical protein